MDKARYVDGKKFMWDGKGYDTGEQAEEASRAYRGSGFETEVVMSEAKHYVYTRKVTKEVVVSS